MLRETMLLVNTPMGNTMIAATKILATSDRHHLSIGCSHRLLKFTSSGAGAASTFREVGAKHETRFKLQLPLESSSITFERSLTAVTVSLMANLFLTLTKEARHQAPEEEFELLLLRRPDF